MNVKQRKILSELLEEAGAEWDAYLDDCRAEEMEPEVTYYDFLANRISENGVILPPCKIGDKLYEEKYLFACKIFMRYFAVLGYKSRSLTQKVVLKRNTT